jgi:Raf kinase inhibitor-like YbhB/YbcL family protein
MEELTMCNHKQRYLYQPASALVWLCLILLFSLALTACGGAAPEPVEEVAVISAPEQADEESQAESEEEEVVLEEQATPTEVEPLVFSISTVEFSEGEAIPTRFSCDGENISPTLEWTGAPEGTSSYVLIMDDPDAPVGTWIHWVLFNIPGDASGIVESIPAEPILPDGSIHGANSWERSDYGGPCPPGGTHRYFFKLYALDGELDLPEGSSLDAVLASMEGHIIAEASLMGTFTR